MDAAWSSTVKRQWILAAVYIGSALFVADILAILGECFEILHIL